MSPRFITTSIIILSSVLSLAFVTAAPIDDYLLNLKTTIESLNQQITALKSSQAPLTPSPSPVVTFSRFLSIGSKGSDVSSLQEILKSLGYYTYPEITGFYGSLTSQAVRLYQEANNLESVGAVGPKTRALLNQTSGASLSTPASLVSSPLLPITDFLTLGSRGEQVTTLQTLLKEQGFFTDEPTGFYGPITQAAVKRFQESHAIESVGYVGPKTRETIAEIIRTRGSAEGSQGAQSNNSSPISSGGGSSFSPSPSAIGGGGGGGGGTPPQVQGQTNTGNQNQTPPTTPSSTIPPVTPAGGGGTPPNNQNQTPPTVSPVSPPIDVGQIPTINQISQYGITWTFDKAYPYGKFVSGDYWVLGPVTVTSITPQPNCDGVNARNGSMLNPRYDERQGYDGRFDSEGAKVYFDANLCKRPPLFLSPGDSLISTESLQPQVSGRFTLLKSAAVLTIVDAVQPASAFRPPYTRPSRVSSAGQDSLIFSADNVKWNLLPRLSKVAGTPSLLSTARKIERPWIDHFESWWGGRIQPYDNMRDYGRENGEDVSEISLQLLLDYTNDEKKPLLYDFIQYGIDLYGVYLDGGMWAEGAGVSQGRKWPLIFAGIMLDHNGMKSPDLKRVDRFGKEEVFIFQEDGQTYYFDDPKLPDCQNIDGKVVSCDTAGAFRVKGVRGWVDKLNGGAGDIVLWRIKDQTIFQQQAFEHLHINNWSLNEPGNYQYRANNYRMCCSSYTYVGYALAARLMNAVGTWNHDPFFDYIDRWMTQDSTLLKSLFDVKYAKNLVYSQKTAKPAPFVGNMWNAYRGTIIPLYNPAVTTIVENQTPPPNNPPPSSNTDSIPPPAILPPSTPSSTNNLVARYTFEDNAQDSAGNNHGTITGDLTYSEGRLGRALSWPGVAGARVTVNNTSPLQMTDNSPYSITYWINLSSFAVPGVSFSAPLTKGHFGASYAHLVSSTGQLNVYTSGDFGVDFSSAGFFNGLANTWVHVVQTYDGDKIALYKNGTLHGTSGGGIQFKASTLPLYIGSNSSSQYPLSGKIDDVRIYNKALSGSEVASLYSTGNISAKKEYPNLASPVMPAQSLWGRILTFLRRLFFLEW